MKTLKIAKEILKIAEDLVYAENEKYKYIPDPDHKKHPGGGYHKTEKGWSNLDEKEKKEESKGKTTDKSTSNVEMTSQQKELDNIAKSGNVNHRSNVAENPNTHPSTLDKLSNDEDLYVRRNVAKNIHTSSETLDKLSKDEDASVRERISNNENTSSETLDKMSNDIIAVRMNIARHKNASPETLDKLSTDDEETVRYAVAGNPNTSDETLKKMSKVKDDGNFGPSYLAGSYLKERKEKRKQERAKNRFDITKLSPEMREKVKDWDIEDIKKFIGWLKEHKG